MMIGKKGLYWTVQYAKPEVKTYFGTSGGHWVAVPDVAGPGLITKKAFIIADEGLYFQVVPRDREGGWPHVSCRNHNVVCVDFRWLPRTLYHLSVPV
jgi:hypothetical protein